MSLSIFQLQGPITVEKCQRSNKAQRFRLQIRKRQHDQKFFAIRKQFVQSLRSIDFLHQLKSQRDNLTAKKIGWVIDGLQTGKDNASFYQQIMDMRLQPCLCQIIFYKEISLQNKTKILKSLVELTYFSCTFPKQFLQSNLVDQLRLQIGKLNIQDQIQQQFTYQSANLILNLTTFQNDQFNNHMTQSDFLPTLQNLVNKPQLNISETMQKKTLQIREVLLQIYKNIIRNGQVEFGYGKALLCALCVNDRNYSQTILGIRCLQLFREFVRAGQFWHHFIELPFQIGKFSFAILSIVDIIAQNFHYKYFNALIQLINELYQKCQKDIQIDTDNLINQFPKRFLLNCLLQLQKEQHQKSVKLTVCKTIKMFSSLKKLQNLVYNSKAQQQQLITAILARYIVENKLYGKYLFRILSKILYNDKTSIDLFIQHGIVEIIIDIFDSEFFKEDKIDVIDLVEKLIDAEEELRNKDQCENKMLNVLYNRGIIKKIQDIQNQVNLDVYKRAEQFMNKVSQISKSCEENRK